MADTEKAYWMIMRELCILLQAKIEHNERCDHLLNTMRDLTVQHWFSFAKCAEWIEKNIPAEKDAR